MPETVTEDGEIIETSLPVPAEMALAGTLARAEFDVQVATAKSYPRSIKTAMDQILTLATYDEQTAAECMYALPRGGKPIKGPSIRLAETIAQQWGNCRVDARVIAIDRPNKMIVAEGTFHDLQTNAATRQVVHRRISDRRGQLYNDDMIAVTGNAACSIARRNAILAGVPRAIWRKAFEAAEHVVAGDIKTLTVRREAALKAFAVFGVKPEQVFVALGVTGIDDVTLEHMPVLLGMHAALKNGEATVEEMFDPRRGGKAFEVVANPLKDTPDETAKPAASPSDPAPAPQPPPPATEQSPPVKPDHLVIAFEAGQEARRTGIKRTTPPGEYRDPGHKDELDQWLRGWDTGGKIVDKLV